MAWAATAAKRAVRPRIVAIYPSATPAPLGLEMSKIVITPFRNDLEPSTYLLLLEGFHELCKFLNPHTHAHHPHSHMLL